MSTKQKGRGEEMQSSKALFKNENNYLKWNTIWAPKILDDIPIRNGATGGWLAGG